MTYGELQEALARFGLPFDPNLVSSTPNSWSFEEARVGFRTFLEERALRPRFDFDAVNDALFHFVAPLQASQPLSALRE